MAFKKSFCLQSSVLIFMQRALRGYHAGPACHHAVSCELFIGKTSLYSNDRFVDSILSMIDLMRVNFECVK